MNLSKAIAFDSEDCFKASEGIVDAKQWHTIHVLPVSGEMNNPTIASREDTHTTRTWKRRLARLCKMDFCRHGYKVYKSIVEKPHKGAQPSTFCVF